MKGLGKAIIFSTILLTTSIGLCAITSSNEDTTILKDPVPIVDMQLGPHKDSIQTVVQYPNGCYEPFYSLHGKKQKTLVLLHVAEFPKGAICTRALQFHETSFSIDELPKGNYNIIDGSDGEKIGELKKKPKEIQLQNQTI